MKKAPSQLPSFIIKKTVVFEGGGEEGFKQSPQLYLREEASAFKSINNQLFLCKLDRSALSHYSDWNHQGQLRINGMRHNFYIWPGQSTYMDWSVERPYPDDNLKIGSERNNLPLIKEGDHVELYYPISNLLPRVQFAIGHLQNTGTLKMEESPQAFIDTLENDEKIELSKSQLLLHKEINRGNVTIKQGKKTHLNYVENLGTFKIQDTPLLINTLDNKKDVHIEGAPLEDFDSVSEAFQKAKAWGLKKINNRTLEFQADNLRRPNSGCYGALEAPYENYSPFQLNINGNLHTFKINQADLCSNHTFPWLYTFENIPDFEEKDKVELFHALPKVQVKIKTAVTSGEFILQDVLRASTESLHNEGTFKSFNTSLDWGTVKNTQDFIVKGGNSQNLKGHTLHNTGTLILENIKDSEIEKIDNQGEMRILQGALKAEVLNNQKTMILRGGGKEGSKTSVRLYVKDPASEFQSIDHYGFSCKAESSLKQYYKEWSDEGQLRVNGLRHNFYIWPAWTVYSLGGGRVKMTASAPNEMPLFRDKDSIELYHPVFAQFALRHLQNLGTLHLQSSPKTFIEKTFNQGFLEIQESGFETYSLENKEKGVVDFKDLSNSDFKKIAKDLNNEGVLRFLSPMDLESLTSVKKRGRLEAGEINLCQPSFDTLSTLTTLFTRIHLLDLNLGDKPFHLKSPLKLMGDFHLKSSQFINESELSAQGKLTIDVLGDVTNGVSSMAKLLSQDVLIITAHKIKNLIGQIFGRRGVTLKAREAIDTGGSSPKYNSIFSASLSYHLSNGSFIASIGDVTLDAQKDISNHYGQIVSLGDLFFKTPGRVTNLSGMVYAKGKGVIEASSFCNKCGDSSPQIKTGNDFSHGSAWWTVYTMNHKTGTLGYYKQEHCKHNYPGQCFPTSAEASFHVDKTLHFKVTSEIKNIGSSLFGGDGIFDLDDKEVEVDQKGELLKDPKRKVSLVFQSLSFPAWVSHYKGSCQFHPNVYVDVMTSTVGSKKKFVFNMPESLLNTGLLSAPQIEIKEGQGPIINKSIGGFSSIQTSTSLEKYGSDPKYMMGLFQKSKEGGSNYYIKSELLESLKNKEDNSITLVVSDTIKRQEEGKSPLRIERTLKFFSPLLEEMIFPEALIDMIGKPYWQANFSTEETIQQWKKNAEEKASKKGSRLMLTDHEVRKTDKPLFVYDLKTIEDRTMAVPRLQLPEAVKEDPLLKEIKGQTGVMAADETIKVETKEDIQNKGTLVANEIDLKANKDILVEKETIRMKVSDHKDLFYDVLLPGGKVKTFDLIDPQNKELKKGTLKMEAQNILLKGAEIDSKEMEIFAEHMLHLLPQGVRSRLQEEDTTTEILRNIPTILQGENIKLKAKLGALVLEAAQLKVDNYLVLHGAKGVYLLTAQDTTHIETHSSEGNILTGSHKIDEVTHFTDRKVTEITNNRGEKVPLIEVLSDIGEIVFEASKMKAKKLDIKAEEKISFNVAQDSHSHSLQEVETNQMVNTTINEGHHSTTYKDCQFDVDEIKLTAKEICAAFNQKTLDDSVLSNTTFMTALKLKNAKIASSQDEFKAWSEVHHSLGSGLSTMIAIGVSIVMPGLGTGVSGAMLTAGAKTLTSQGIIGMINNGGDPFKTLKDMTSGDSLRGLAITLGTAGLLEGASDHIRQLEGFKNFSLHPRTLDFMEHVRSSMVQTAVKIPVEGIFSKKGFNDVLKDSLISGAVMIASSYGASHIGDLSHSGKLDDFSHKMAHAALGAATSAALKKDPIAGAVGAVIGEMIASKYRQQFEEKGEWTEKDQKKYERDLEKGIDIARFVTASIATLTNLDAETASNAAGNAARHNALMFVPLVVGGASLAFTAYEAYEVYDIYQTQGAEKALQHLALYGAITIATVGTGKAIYHVGSMAYPSAQLAFKAVMASNPHFYKAVTQIHKGQQKFMHFAEKAEQKVATLFKKEGKASQKLPELGTQNLSRQTNGLEGLNVEGLFEKTIHKNSLQYIGDTHLYIIQNEKGKIFKYGESAMGKNQFGQSKRAQMQIRKLKQQDENLKLESQIIKELGSKKEARDLEARYIKTHRKVFGKDSLPLNKGNH